MSITRQDVIQSLINQTHGHESGEPAFPAIILVIHEAIARVLIQGEVHRLNAIQPFVDAGLLKFQLFRLPGGSEIGYFYAHWEDAYHAWCEAAQDKESFPDIDVWKRCVDFS